MKRILIPAALGALLTAGVAYYVSYDDGPACVNEFVEGGALVSRGDNLNCYALEPGQLAHDDVPAVPASLYLHGSADGSATGVDIEKIRTALGGDVQTVIDGDQAHTDPPLPEFPVAPPVVLTK